jgi:plasmid rolling circle replication initiator protein Rep
MSISNIRAESTSLSSYSKKDAVWDKHRSDAQSVEEIYSKRFKYNKLAARMNECSGSLGFDFVVNKETGERKLHLQVAHFCKVRNCPVCAWRKSLKNVSRFFAAIPALQAAYPTSKWIFLTLTAKNCKADELREQLKIMNAGWQRLIQRKDWPAIGFVKSTEVTRADDGKAHPHFHCLLQVKSSYFSHGYISHEQWVANWKSAMRLDYEPVVDVRVVKSKKEGQTLEAAIVETLKYSTKVEDAFKDPEWLYTITEQLHKLRFIATGGTLKNIIKEEMTTKEMICDDIADDETNDESEENPMLWFGWKRQERKYRRDK